MAYGIGAPAKAARARDHPRPASGTWQDPSWIDN